MASNSGWSKGLPSGISNIALGDNDIRSNQSVVQAAFEDEHYFTDGSANSAGVHKEGSARAFVQATAPTAVAPKGQLWLDTDTDRLYVAEAAGTGSWTTVLGDVTLTSAQTFSALQEFTSGVSASQLTVTGTVRAVSGVTTSHLTASSISVSNLTTATLNLIGGLTVSTLTATSGVTTSALTTNAMTLTGIFSNITSLTSTLAADLGGADNSSPSVIIDSSGRFARGDVILVSTNTMIGSAAGNLRPLWATNSNTDLYITLDINNAGSRCTIPAGATIRVLGFKMV